LQDEDFGSVLVFGDGLLEGGIGLSEIFVLEGAFGVVQAVRARGLAVAASAWAAA
jgi:hypothetical protein